MKIELLQYIDEDVNGAPEMNFRVHVAPGEKVNKQEVNTLAWSANEAWTTVHTAYKSQQMTMQ